MEELDLNYIKELFKSYFYKNPKRLAIHNHASNVESFEVLSKDSLNTVEKLKAFILNKSVQIKYTQDVNALKDNPLLKKRTLKLKSPKFRLANTSTTNYQSKKTTGGAKIKTVQSQEKTKINIMKIQKLVKEFSEVVKNK